MTKEETLRCMFDNREKLGAMDEDGNSCLYAEVSEIGEIGEKRCSIGSTFTEEEIEKIIAHGVNGAKIGIVCMALGINPEDRWGFSLMEIRAIQSDHDNATQHGDLPSFIDKIEDVLDGNRLSFGDGLGYVQISL